MYLYEPFFLAAESQHCNYKGDWILVGLCGKVAAGGRPTFVDSFVACISCNSLKGNPQKY